MRARIPILGDASATLGGIAIGPGEVRIEIVTEWGSLMVYLTTDECHRIAQGDLKLRANLGLPPKRDEP